MLQNVAEPFELQFIPRQTVTDRAAKGIFF